MNYDSEQIDQNDEDADLAKEHFKNKNKSLKEANNKLSEENDLLYADFKKSQAELKRQNSIEYALEMELECAKELIHYCLKNPPYELGWKEKFVLDSEGNPTTTTEKVFETYKNVTQDIRDQLNAEAEAVQIILTGIDNDIYSTVDACPNACEMWKAIERTQQAATRNRGKEIVNSPQPIYDQEPSMVNDNDDDEMSKDKEIDELMALISLSFKKIYKPTNNNLRNSSNTSRANHG
nr:hypothetical protein [Tanacetum cinerariifolium]